MSQKESEWEKDLGNLMEETGSHYYSACEYVYPDTPECYYEKEYKELVNKWKLFIREAISTREKEIAEEVKKKIAAHKEIILTHDSFPRDWHEGNLNALDDILQILNHNQ